MHLVVAVASRTSRADAALPRQSIVGGARLPVRAELLLALRARARRGDDHAAGAAEAEVKRLLAIPTRSRWPPTSCRLSRRSWPNGSRAGRSGSLAFGDTLWRALAGSSEVRGFWEDDYGPVGRAAS